MVSILAPVETDAERKGPQQKKCSRVGETVMKTLVKFAKCESGATAIEYGLIAALIGVVIITAVKNVGNNLTSTFNKVAANI
jgi:pilus assembly protein Flp/PilA